MNLRRTRAMFRKEFLHIIRDPRSLAAALLQPLMMLLLFGYALSLDVDRIPTVIYDLDRTPVSDALIKDFRGSRYFQIVEEVHNYRPIDRGIDSRRELLASSFRTTIRGTWPRARRPRFSFCWTEAIPTRPPSPWATPRA